MAEQLLLRKGSLAGLASQEIIPGAISITTDVPGIYLDVDADTRIRIGDFITVSNLSQLNQLAKTGLSETALYYVESDNILARYSSAVQQADGSTKPGLVWINDTTAIESDIAAIEAYIDNTLKPKLTDINLAIKAIQDALGSATAGHKATHTLDGDGNATTTVKTVYKSIEDEYDRATGVEGALQSQIDAIRGTGTGSIGALEQALKQEKEDRAQADTNINNTVNGINTRLTQAEADIDSLEDSVGYVKPAGGKSLKTLLDEEIARATAKENTLQGNINTLEGTVLGNKTAAENLVKTEKERAEAQEAAIRGEFAAADAKIREDFAEADAALLEEINNNIAAANSMTFKGSISYNDAGTDLKWPTSGVKAGDTYVVYASNMIGAHTYHAGDLIVAKHDQDTLENITTYPTGTGENGGWIHVETGYNAATQSALSAKENKVVLTSHAGVTLGEVGITTESPNLEITTSGTSAIQVNLVWSNFT